MTGAVIPQNTDIVIPQEFTTKVGKQITVDNYIGGDNIRFAGEDLAKDSVVLKKGRLLNAADLGLLASLGIAEVSVWRKLRVHNISILWNNCTCHNTDTGIFFDFFITVLTCINCSDNSKRRVV
jgi:hypothetical protein